MSGPRAAPSLVCIADLGHWSVMRMIYDGPGLVPDELWQARVARTGLPMEGAATVGYTRWFNGYFSGDQTPPNPIASAVANVLGRLAHDDSSVRPMSHYFFAAGLGGSGAGTAGRVFSLNTYSAEVRSQLPYPLTNGVAGSEWAMNYSF